MTLLLSTIPACTDAIEEPDRIELAEVDTNHVSGVFAEDGVRVDFEFTRSDGGHAMTLRGSDGRVLATSVLADGIERATYLDRLTITGRPDDGEPFIEGDPAAIGEFRNSPEGRLFAQLSPRLAQLQIDSDLYAPSLPEITSLTVAYIGCNQSRTLGTWSLYIFTKVGAMNESSYYRTAVRFTDNWVIPLSVTATIHPRQWIEFWGADWSHFACSDCGSGTPANYGVPAWAGWSVTVTNLCPAGPTVVQAWSYR